MKFANSYRLISDAVLDDTWHPLDGGPAPEYVPERWDGPHVGKRLVEGLRTLMLMPAPSGPRMFGNHWPVYAHDWCDLLAQAEMDEDQRELIERAKNKTRLRASSTEVSRMENSIGWPCRYLREIQQLMRTVQAVALARARDADIRSAARRLRQHPDVVRERNNSGLAQIARGLQKDKVRIW